MEQKRLGIIGGMGPKATAVFMNMLVDLSTSSKSYDLVRDALDERGLQMGLSIRIQREDIFNAMHRI